MEDEAYDLLQEIDSEGEGLTDWERRFVADLIDREELDYNGEPSWSCSQREADKIREIHEARIR